MFQRMGSKRYSVAKNENQWVKKHFGKFLSTPQVIINDNRHSYRKRSQQLCLTMLPILEVVILDICIVACYIIGIKTKKIMTFPYVPYANELSFSIPGRGLFVIGLISSLLMFAAISVLRHKQVALIYNGMVNKLSFVCAIGSAASMIFIAAFPFDTKENAVDQTAAAFYFSFTIFYYLIQTIITRKTPTISSGKIFAIRLILIELIVVVALIFAVFQHPKLLHKNEPPYSIAPIVQWLLIAFIHLFKLTFIGDMNQLYFAFDVWIASKKLDVPSSRTHLQSFTEEEERATIITTDDNDNDEYCMMRTEV